MPPSASALRLRISSPLEAGTSILDTQHTLPSTLTDALEYTSKRLARKNLHITLVVVRKDYQLPQHSSASTPPSVPGSATSASFSVPPTPTSPPPSAGPYSSLTSPLRSPMAGLRSLVRKGTHASLASLYSPSTHSASGGGDGQYAVGSATSSPMFPPPRRGSGGAIGSSAWPPTPGSISSPMPCFTHTPNPYSPPMTPHTPGSIFSSMSSATDPASLRGGAGAGAGTTAPAVGSTPTGEFSLRLIYTTPLSCKDDKTVRTVLEKASRKFRSASGAAADPSCTLPLAATTAAACGLNADLVRRSIIQNEVLFCSEGLTLLGLDRLYTFKAALACYARAATAGAAAKTVAQRRIEETVDELRRLVLGGDGSCGSGSAGGYFGFSPGRPRQVSRSDLHRSYDWIRVSPSALSAVEKMYKRAYGGLSQIGAFEPSPAEEEERERELEERRQEEEDRREYEEARMRRNMIKIGTPPPGRATPLAAGRATSPAAGLKISTTNLGSIANLPRPVVVRPKPVSSPQLPVVAVAQEESSSSEPEQLQRQPQLSPRRTNGKAPKLTLQTAAPVEIKIEKVETDKEGDDESDHGDRTARPFHGMPFWSNIDELLSPVEGKVERRQSDKLGPMTPNGYDDISPITRGEWGFLFSREGTFNEDRTAPVETW